MRVNSRRWDDRFYVRVYELRRAGIATKKAAARALGVHHSTFTAWFAERPALADAWARAGLAAAGAQNWSFKDYVFERLPIPLQRVWSEIQMVQHKRDAALRVAALTGDLGVRARQHLFLHALTTNGYNPSVALTMVCVPLREYKQWLRDPEFAELVEEIEFHKDNFFESKYIDLVDQGEPGVVMHAARTRLKRRGYGDPKEVHVQHSGQVNHAVGVLDLNAVLDKLSLNARRELLGVVRANNAANGTPQLDGTVLEGEVED